MAKTKAIRGRIFHFIKDPFTTKEEESYEYFPDGLLLIQDGFIKKADHYSKLIDELETETEITHYENELIIPGFIDTHIHYPQTEMICSYGEQLIEWLNMYTFPVEKKFQNEEYAHSIAKFFIQQLLKNGTTTALIFATVHPQSVDALFEEADKYNLRLISGKVLMDRNAPHELLDTPESAFEESKKLIIKWHNKKRFSYAITPRFAITSSPEQLHAAGELKREFPDVYIQTHLSENKKEISSVLKLFPDFEDYLSLYDHFGLVTDKSIFAHGIYLSKRELSRMSQSEAAISFCASSNLFLGSGLFNLEKTKELNIKVGIGSDIGAGTSFSILKTLSESYKVLQLQGQKLSALKSIYLATLGGAKSLSLDDKIGNFESGKEADFIILSLKEIELLRFRSFQTHSLSEILFGLIMLGDERAIKATYVMGEMVYNNSFAHDSP